MQSNKLRRERRVRDGSGILLPQGKRYSGQPDPIALVLCVGEGERPKKIIVSESLFYI